MPESKVYTHRGESRVQFNMTPMIDVTFQLIIFFMLTTQIASAEFVQMKLPKPFKSVAKEIKENKAIINVVPYPEKDIAADESKLGLAQRYQVGGERIELHNLEKLVGLLKAKKAASPDPKHFSVEVRADLRIHYSQIQPILRALQEARMERMRITALVVGRDE